MRAEPIREEKPVTSFIPRKNLQRFATWITTTSPVRKRTPT